MDFSIYPPPNDNTIVRILNTEIKTPTKIIIHLDGIFRVTNAPIGAAITPPVNSPSTVFHWSVPRVRKKVMASTTVTKNSLALTEPMAFLGGCPQQ